MSDDGRGSERADLAPYQGDARSAPYPVGRLAPAFDSGALASEVAQAEAMLNTRANAKLQVIAEQIRRLQQDAREVLAIARTEHELAHARCGFRRIPGHVYHLYRDAADQPFFSMLAPGDFGGRPPWRFAGSYRLERDYSWSCLTAACAAGDCASNESM